ncbi:MAG: hypothetical protein IKB33_04735 [Spirochaetaceae bacterium]|nr:hypothetical protein [Spirochaetaceae bacterium]
MAEWGKVYKLKGNVSVCCIWKCIAGFLQSRTNQELSLPESSPPRYFFWQDAAKSFSWLEDDEWGCFDFAGVLGNAESFLQIIFSKKEKNCGKEKSRLLSFYEKSSGSQFLFLDFLRMMKEKKLVLDKTNPPKKIEHAQKKFDSDDNLKILVSDHRDGELLGQVNDLAEELWFLGANFYSRNEIDYMADLVEKDPVISVIKERMSPKMERQVSSKSNFTEMLEGWEGFQEAKQMFRPSVSMMYNGQEKELSFDAMASSADLIPEIIALVFEINKDDFYESQEREFKDFLDNHGEKALSEIQRQVREQAMNQFLANQSLKELENQCKDEKTDSSVPSLEQETVEKLTQENEALSRRIRELENRLTDLEHQNTHSKAEGEGLREGYDRLENENKELKQKICDLQGQLNKKKDTYTLRQNEERNGFVRLEIPCAEKNLFPDEIEDWLYSVVYAAIEQEGKMLPEDTKTEVSRKRDVIEAVLNGKEFDWNKSETCRTLTDMEKAFKNDASPSLAGFTKVSENDHEKHFFVQERYQITSALTPSDNRTGRWVQNKMTEIRGRLFLMPQSVSDSGSSADS